jgi:UDP-glucose 4-epimerase
VFEAAVQKARRPLRLIFASSDQVYPGPFARYRPTDETHPSLPTTFYGMSKVVGEDMLRFYGRSEKDVNISIARFAHVEAPEELIDPNGFFAHRLFYVNGRLNYLKKSGSQDPKVLATIKTLEPLAAPDEPLLLPYDREGRPYYQELTDVRDTVAGLLLILDRPEAIGEAFNLGPPAIVNMAEFIPYMAKATGRRYVEARLDLDAPLCQASSAKARALLGYEPRYTMFDMIDEAVKEF